MISSKIPRVIHVYWGSPTEEMSYLRYVSLLSIKKFCTGWTVKLHVPSVAGGAVTWKTGEQSQAGGLRENFFGPALDAADEVIRHNFEDYGFKNDAHEVHKADFLRWHLLSGEGGIWCDLDILFFKSIDQIGYQSGLPEAADTIIHIYPDLKSHAIGLLGSAPKNELFALCKKRSYNESLSTYQAIGAELLNNGYKTMDRLTAAFPQLMVANITKSSVYHISPVTIPRLHSIGQLVDFPVTSIGCHWFGGHKLSQQYESLVYGPSVFMPNNTMSKMIKDVVGAG